MVVAAASSTLAQSLRRGGVFRLPAPDAYVKGFKHIDGYGLGMRLMYVWLGR